MVHQELMDKYFDMHQSFLVNHGNDIGIHITDDNYSDRFDLCLAQLLKKHNFIDV